MIHRLRNLDHLHQKSGLAASFQRSKDRLKKNDWLASKLGSRKHFWKLLILDLVLWSIFAGVVWLFSPEVQLGVGLFFSSLCLAILVLTFLLTYHKRRMILITVALMGLVILRFYRLDQWFNMGMLLGLVVTIELLFVVE